MGIESILRNTHGVDHATGTVVRLATMMGIGVREDNLHTTRRDALARARSFEPIFVPPLHHAAGQCVHVVVVVQCRRSTIEGAVALLVEGVAVLVPVLAQALVAVVLHGPHGLRGRLVDVEHLATILSLGAVEHLARADGATALRVILVANLLHLEHVVLRDAVVAALVEDNAWVIPIIYNSIAHELRALLPTGTVHIFLGVTGRHGLDKSHAVARLDVLLPGAHVHPAHQIAAALHGQVVAIVTEPCGNADTHAGPLVRGTLGVAVHHEHAVVQEETAVPELGLAEAGTGDDVVYLRAIVGLQQRLYCIQVAVAPRPEVQPADLARHTDRAGLAWLHGDTLPVKVSHLTAIKVEHLGKEGERALLRVVVPHLRLGMYGGLAGRDVEVGGIDIRARSTKVAVERQRLIELVRDVQEHVLRQTAVVGVEVLVVPLVAAVQRAIAILPRVVAAHGDGVLACLHKRCQVEAEGHHAVVTEAHFLAVHPHVGTLTGTLELDEDL